MNFSKEKYYEMLSSVINQLRSDTSDVEVEKEHLTDLLNDLGIETDKNKVYKLILWNDHVNNMLDIVIALFEICKLKNQDAIDVMMEAHEKGKAVAKTGSKDEISAMKIALNDRNIEATIECD
jgi:ATP-dependent Clp protease adapter protein ClpS